MNFFFDFGVLLLIFDTLFLLVLRNTFFLVLILYNSNYLTDGC